MTDKPYKDAINKVIDVLSAIQRLEMPDRLGTEVVNVRADLIALVADIPEGLDDAIYEMRINAEMSIGTQNGKLLATTVKAATILATATNKGE